MFDKVVRQAAAWQFLFTFCVKVFIDNTRLRIAEVYQVYGYFLSGKMIMIHRGRNKPTLPRVRRISDMLKITCPHTCSLVQVLVHFVGPKLDALDRQNRKHESHRFFKFLIWSV